MMKRAVFLSLFLLLGFTETAAVKCNDGCAVLSGAVNEKGDSIHHHLPEGLSKSNFTNDIVLVRIRFGFIEISWLFFERS